MPNCDAIYRSVVEDFESGSYVLFDLAACFIGGYDPDKLRVMLRSDDLGIVSDGLFVAEEIGSLARNYVEDYLTLSHSNDVVISERAAKLLKAYS